MNKIRELRLEKSLTQTELGEILGVNQTAIGKYERGELEPNCQNLIKLADLFECSIDYLIGRTDDFGNISVPMNAGEQLSPAEKKLLDNYRKLNSKGKYRVEAYMDVRLEEQLANEQKA